MRVGSGGRAAPSFGRLSQTAGERVVANWETIAEFDVLDFGKDYARRAGEIRALLAYHTRDYARVPGAPILTATSSRRLPVPRNPHQRLHRIARELQPRRHVHVPRHRQLVIGP